VPAHFPTVSLHHLDALWFQVAGTLCNLRCNHCFISCSPENQTLPMMSLAQVEHHVRKAVELGVKEFYFTGGEPFLHPQIEQMLSAALAIGPVTVLTNATRFTPERVAGLTRLRDASPYSLELRTSLDGFSSETNDPIRGWGSFQRILHGIRLLLEGGFLPIITAMRSWPVDQDEAQLAGFRNLLAAMGYRYPRIKLLPSLKLGQEVRRDRGYAEREYLTESMMAGFDPGHLMCSSGRIVSARGVHVCPILVDWPDSYLGASLHEGQAQYTLRHQACLTCCQFGALCANASSSAPSLEQTRRHGRDPS
jgi:AdoMet-dependent heme synthase